MTLCRILSLLNSLGHILSQLKVFKSFISVKSWACELSKMAVVRIGIMSTAGISYAIIKDAKQIPTAEVVAVSSRDLFKAEAHAAKHGISRSMSHDELLNDSGVDAIYIPLPTTKCVEWGVRAANCGKHILVDKPFASAEAVTTLRKACQMNNVIFLDGTHFVHAKRTTEVRQRISSGDIGKVLSIHSSFHAPTPDLSTNIRSDPTLEPLGSLGDLGWYSVRAIVTFLGIDVMNEVDKMTVIPTWHHKFKDVLYSVQVNILFKTGIFCTFSNHYQSSIYQDIVITGTLGSIKVHDFVAPTHQTYFYADVRPDGAYTHDLSYTIKRDIDRIEGEDSFVNLYPDVREVVVKEDNDVSQVAKMLKEFCRMIIEKDMDASIKWSSESLSTQTILDRLFQIANSS